METQVFNKTVVYTDINHIAVLPLCEYFGITYRWQIDKIKADPILKFEWTKMSSQIAFGDKKNRVCLSKKGFVRWIQLLKPDSVSEEMRERLIQYQSNIFDWMFGNVQSSTDTRKCYLRLQKLKKLQSKIQKEIANCQDEINLYIHSHFSNQLKIDFSSQESSG